MNKLKFGICALLLILLLGACGAERVSHSGSRSPAQPIPAQSPEKSAEDEEAQRSLLAAGEVPKTKILVQVEDSHFTATLAKTPAADSFVQMMGQGPVTVQMGDYGGFEKVGPLGAELPADDRQITARPGDIVLYSQNQIVVFYGSNTWDYTELGKIDDLSGWAEALGGGDVQISFSQE